MQFCNLTGEWCDTKVYSWLCKIRDEWVAGRLSIWVFENDKKKTNLPLFALSINPFVRWRPYLWDLFFCFKGPALCLCCSLDIFPFLQPQNNTTCKLGWWNSTGRDVTIGGPAFCLYYLYPGQHFWGMIQRIVTSWIKN